jgi:hypothetical protein
MKRLFVLVPLTILAASALLHAQAPVPDPTLAPDPGAPVFAFDNQTFSRVATSPTKTGTMDEYLPAGQTLAHWTTMVSVHHLTTAVADPVAATQAVAQAVRQHNPSAQVVLMNNAATGDALIDFVTWPPASTPDGNPAYIEYDICKYRKAPQGGLMALQYILRAYGSDEPAFMRSLKDTRARLTPLMAAAPFGSS